jgi:hypothetical protein
MAKAKVHGNLPEKIQERPFADLLGDLDFGATRVHVWYTRILGTRDVDAVLLAEGLGLFVIELKSINLSAIKEINGDNGLILQDNVKSSTKKTAWLQAIDAAESLQNKIQATPTHRDMLKDLWIAPGAALFRIYRESFLVRFGRELQFRHAAEELADGMIFAEDLIDGRTFLKRLEYIKAHPLYKAAPNRRKDKPDLYDEQTALSLDAFIRFKLTPAETLTATEMARLRRIEDEEERHLDQINQDHHVICSGYAGTGKTLLGLQLALRRKVPTLFTCYNKVLATDIRRLTSMGAPFLEFSFEAFDVFQLLGDCERRLGLRPDRWDKTRETWEEYEARRVSKVIEADFDRGARLRSEWELVIVDEGQDIADAFWALIDYLTGGSSKLFVIDGKNQLLYRSSSCEYLTDGLPSVIPPENQREKRRVYRNTSETFLLAQLFVQSYPSLERAQRIWTQTLQKRYRAHRKTVDQDQFDFELMRENGGAPSVLNIDQRTSGDIVQQITASLKKKIDQLRMTNDGTPSDILILLPYGKPDLTWRPMAINACQSAGFDYIDYTDEENRRASYSPDEIRLCTFHSSRGIEGLHTIVLGFDQLHIAAKQSDTSAANLGYISLTRSAFETEVYYSGRKDVLSGSPAQFLTGVAEITGF